ncbi:glycosyltransferase [Synechococcus sp. GEYO]|uniref:glycosyltransferase n=1 Tax=Synechococcus sp. GEYO TaxID=2575511 RepID=UPI000E0FEF3B|nr:glycosyltransferase [Synechococcus sp. GEYO]
MQILVIHQGFPGQFIHLLPRLNSKGYKITAISKPWKGAAPLPSWLNFHSYVLRRGNSLSIHEFCSEMESKTLRAEAVALKALELKKEGYQPDLILGHPGWGEMLFLSEIWPKAPQLHYVEFFHGVPGTDDDFDGGLKLERTWVDGARAKIKNAHNLSCLNQMTQGITPTKFQHSLLPKWAQERTTIVHDGIDTNWLKPNSKASLEIPAHDSMPKNLKIKHGDPLITFINRTFEPYRGIHIFMRALTHIQKQHPQLQTILIGQDTANVSYGKKRNDGKGWLTTLRNELGTSLDWSRIHQMGLVSHSSLLKIFQISSAHIYLSYPFVLSWSLLEAMSCGCLVIGSDTPPVKEVIKDGINGYLVPFNDEKAISNTVTKALEQNSGNIRISARAHIQTHYELQDCLEKQIALIENFA